MYTSKRGYYTTRELQYLSVSLGHDEKLFERVLKKLSLNKARYSDEEINRWLDDGLLDEDLHYIFNRHSYKYNVKVFKKAIYFLRYRHLTFDELMCGRIVYEVSTVKDPFELLMDITQISQTLKLCDKIIPPLRMKRIFQSMKNTTDTVGRIKIYEFYEILALSESITSARTAMVEYLECGKRIDFDETEIEFEQLSRFMNERYKASILKPAEKKCIRAEISTHMQALVIKNSVHKRSRNSQSAQEKTYQRLNPAVASSSQLLVQARAGQHVLSFEQGNNALARLCKYTPYASAVSL